MARDVARYRALQDLCTFGMEYYCDQNNQVKVEQPPTNLYYRDAGGALTQACDSQCHCPPDEGTDECSSNINALDLANYAAARIHTVGSDTFSDEVAQAARDFCKGETTQTARVDPWKDIICDADSFGFPESDDCKEAEKYLADLKLGYNSFANTEFIEPELIPMSDRAGNGAADRVILPYSYTHGRWYRQLHLVC